MGYRYREATAADSEVAALEHTFARGGRIDPFLAVFMSDAPRLDGERYLITNPPFFV
ncbi:MAG: hypothetical protein ACXVAE_02090 [Candidatus Limnocylindrales bacterium]